MMTKTQIEQEVRAGCRRTLAGEGMGTYQVWLGGIKDGIVEFPFGNLISKEEFCRIATEELSKYFDRLTNPLGS